MFAMSFFLVLPNYLVFTLGYHPSEMNHVIWQNLYYWYSIPLLVAIFIASNDYFLKKVDFNKIFKVYLLFVVISLLISFLPFSLRDVFPIVRYILVVNIVVPLFYVLYKTRSLTHLQFLLSILCFTVAGFSQARGYESLSIFSSLIAYVFLALIFVGDSLDKKSDRGVSSYFPKLKKKLIITERALKASEERYGKIVQTSPNGIFILDKQTMKFKYANPSICRMLGYSKDDLEQLGIEDITPKKNLQDNISTFEELIKGKKTTAVNIPCLKRDGDIIYVDIQASIVLIGEEERVVAFFDDITEKKIMSEKIQEQIKFLKESEKAALNIMEDLQDTTEKLERMSQIKSAILNVTSHELRTPMSAIKGYIQIILKGNLGTINEEQKNALNIILRNTNRLDTLIQDILDISRLESGTMKFVVEKTDIKKLVKEAVETMQASADLKRIKINAETEIDIPELTIDRDRITQVVINLLNNAIKFSPDGSMINIKARKENEDVLFEVQDCGRGIPKEHRKKIFQTFYQVDSSADTKFGGAGLGLAICYGVVVAHGGRIWVESTGKPGEGSIFRFNLPVESISNIEERFKGVDVFGLEKE